MILETATVKCIGSYDYRSRVKVMLDIKTVVSSITCSLITVV